MAEQSSGHMLAVASEAIEAGTIVCVEFGEDGDNGAMFVKKADGACLVQFIKQAMES